MADAGAVIGTVPNHLFIVVILRLYLASAAAKAMATIAKDLGSRLAEVPGSIKEISLSSQVVTMQVIVRIALARGVLLERRLQFIGYTDVAHHQAALLVLEYAVDPGQWPVSGCGLHRFVHVQGVHAGRIESFLSRTITRLSGSSVHEKRWHHCLKGTFF